MSDFTVDSQPGTGRRVLRPNLTPFIVRGAIWGSLALAILAIVVIRNATGASVIALFFLILAGLEWMTLTSSSITLDDNGFEYTAFGKKGTSLRWADIESFCVVKKGFLGMIGLNDWLGWRYSPAYKHYKRLAIPMAITRAVGMADGMIKTPGFKPKELATLMTEHLNRARLNPAQKSRMRDSSSHDA